jgi:ribonuclease VapC
MVIDTSAIVAIFLKEPESPQFIALIGAASTRFVSAGTLLECGIALDQRPRPAPGVDELAEFLTNAGISVVPLSEAHAQLARAAYRRYGRGIHRAQLNFGDCMSYALAKSLDEPLLFKGTDFRLTDVRVAQ